MNRGYLIYGLLVLALFGYAQYHGWTLGGSGAGRSSGSGWYWGSGSSSGGYHWGGSSGGGWGGGYHK